jgi:hypothetical protein
MCYIPRHDIDAGLQISHFAHPEMIILSILISIDITKVCQESFALSLVTLLTVTRLLNLQDDERKPTREPGPPKPVRYMEHL